MEMQSVGSVAVTVGGVHPEPLHHLALIIRVLIDQAVYVVTQMEFCTLLIHTTIASANGKNKSVLKFDDSLDR